MKRELWALTLLVLLCAGAALNVCTADRLIGAVEQSLDRAEHAAARSDFDTALLALNTARDLWDGYRCYTHIFLRHPDLDAIQDAFFELEGELRQEDPGWPAVLALLRYHLDTADDMEHLSPGTIF